jgi:hypothetical protein
MRRVIFAKAILPGVIAALVVALLCQSESGAPRAESGQSKQKGVLGLEKSYYGNKYCGTDGCHGNLKPSPEGEQNYKGFRAVFSRRHELTEWDTKDKHKNATKILTEGRGKEMADRLGLKLPLTDKDGRSKNEWKQCLTCHGVFIDDPELVDKDSFGAEARVESGVSCVVCHGPYTSWVGEHSNPVGKTWRKTTREEKETKYGLKDLWNPRNRADLCCSCHVGNAAEGKVVTHDMYAAGHPPLPGFEIVTFSDAMPRHWETPSEKYNRLPKSKNEFDVVYHFDEGYEFQQVRLLLTSAVVSFRNSVEVIAARAAAAQKAEQVKDASDTWPEFAVYDCYACHHDLKAKSWRQERGYGGNKPGRPMMRAWATALMPLAMSHLGGDQAKEFDAKLKALEASFSKEPFGRPSEVAETAGALVAWADSILTELADTKKTPLTKSSTLELLPVLVKRPAIDLMDFDSARQVAWCLTALRREGDMEPLKEPRLDSAFDVLHKSLKLDLLKGQQPIIGPYLEESLLRLSNYEAEEFRKQMKAIAAALPKKVK